MSDDSDNNDNSNSIYILFLETPFKMGKFIRAITRYNYNHAALSFNKNANVLYSFARYNKNSPFVGGFVEESPLRYIKCTNKETKVKVFKIDLDSISYIAVKEYVENIKTNKSEYIYNLFSAMTYPIHKEIKIKKAYICIDFIVNVLKQANILPKKSKKRYDFYDLSIILDKHKVYEGNFRNILSSTPFEEDNFFKKVNRRKIILDTLKSIQELSYRLLRN